MMSYFNNLFTANQRDDSDIIDCVQIRLSEGQNEMLIAPITEEEVKAALFSMHPDKSSGMDGMSPTFYQHFWNITGKDVTDAVSTCFSYCFFPTNLNDTAITLIPKKKKVKSMSDLRPISLCNVMYKIVSKVLANQLKCILSLLISKNQSAFVPGRLITDNIMAAYETMHYLKRKSYRREGFAALKINMSMAYDRIE